MDPNTDYMENMARAYSEKLASSPTVAAAAAAVLDDTLTDQLSLLLENQLDVIGNMLNFQPNRYYSKLLNYLKTLKYNSLRELNKLQGGEYIPSFRTPGRLCSFAAAKNRLIDLQIDVFVTLDRLSQTNPELDLSRLITLENRAMGIMAAII